MSLPVSPCVCVLRTLLEQHWQTSRFGPVPEHVMRDTDSCEATEPIGNARAESICSAVLCCPALQRTPGLAVYRAAGSVLSLQYQSAVCRGAVVAVLFQ